MVSEHEKRVERITTSTPNNGYIEWLVKTCKLAEVTARNYYSLVRRAEEIAKEQELVSQRLLAAGNYEEAQATYRELLSNHKFISMNATAHNGFTASINKYLQYLLSGGAKSLSSMSKPVKLRYDKELTEQLKGNYLNIVNKLTVNIMLFGEKLETSPLRSGTRQGCPFSPLLLNIILEVLDREIRQKF